MRERVIATAFATVHALLASDAPATLRSLAFDACAAYVAWADVAIVANDAVMAAVADAIHAADDDVRDAAVATLCALVRKGMPAEDKCGACRCWLFAELQHSSRPWTRCSSRAACTRWPRMHAAPTRTPPSRRP